MTNKFIVFISFSIFIFFVGCKDEGNLTTDFKEAYSKNFNVKEVLKKKNISSPEKIKLDNPDYYFIFGKSYFNSYGYDPFSKFLMNKA
ncbi:MAG TPA: hypothetical protein PLO89_11700, partial [Spirochaetota bacterium]|nr:hypothetical protein [Spirochaetota bacterium]